MIIDPSVLCQLLEHSLSIRDPTWLKYGALHLKAKELQLPRPTEQLALCTGRNKQVTNYVYRQPQLRTLTASYGNNFEVAAPLLGRNVTGHFCLLCLYPPGHVWV